jgi:(p)ppGpp synthase/HD superfamily hydrolase
MRNESSRDKFYIFQAACKTAYNAHLEVNDHRRPIGEYSKDFTILPYIVHPYSVARKALDVFESHPEQHLIASICVLHDTIEDTNCKEPNLVELGFPEYVIEGVKYWTDPDDIKNDYKGQRFIDEEIPLLNCILKSFDVLDNLMEKIACGVDDNERYEIGHKFCFKYACLVDYILIRLENKTESEADEVIKYMNVKKFYSVIEDIKKYCYSK